MAEAAVEESRSLLEAATAVPTAAARRRCPRPALLLLLRYFVARAVLVAQHPPEDLGHGDVKGLIKLD